MWMFFIAPAPAETARRLETGLIREAIVLRGRMDSARYDRLAPSQDSVRTGGLGNLIAAPLHGRARRDGATVFLDVVTMEPNEDRWANLSSLSRMTPGKMTRLAGRAGGVATGTGARRQTGMARGWQP